MSSLGLLYTTFASGDDAIMVPNSVVLGQAITPLHEPAGVDLRARLRPGVTPIDVHNLLQEGVETPIRGEPRVTLEEMDGDEIVVRIAATPERAADGPKLAGEVLTAVAPETRRVETTRPSALSAWPLRHAGCDALAAELVRDLRREGPAPTAASAVPSRSSSGATVTSPRSRSTAVTVASATRSGDTVRKPEEAPLRSRRTCRRRARSRGRRSRPRRPCRGGRPAGRRRSRAARTSSPRRASRPRPARGPRATT